MLYTVHIKMYTLATVSMHLHTSDPDKVIFTSPAQAPPQTKIWLNTALALLLTNITSQIKYLIN